MTTTETIDFACPKCKEKSPVTLHKAINATADPEARKALLEGKINQVACPKCGQKGYLLVSLLYHDMDRKFLVQYHPFPAVQSDQFLRDFDSSGRPKIESGNQGATPTPRQGRTLIRKLKYFSEMHIVFDMAELMRYIVFRERLHDVQQQKGSKDSRGQGSK